MALSSENEPTVGDAYEFAEAIGTSLTAILLAGEEAIDAAASTPEVDPVVAAAEEAASAHAPTGVRPVGADLGR